MDEHEAQLEQGVTPENQSTENNNMASLLEQEGINIEFPCC